MTSASRRLLVVAILWRRLDTPGHDACGLVELRDGWRVQGTAAFRHLDGRPALLAYDVACDREWHTRSSHVRGWIGEREVEIHVRRLPSGAWSLNGEPVPEVQGCVDLDLGFTPATNLLPIRRVALDVGERADVRAAWLDVSVGALTALDQSYERRDEGTYWYEAPRFGYAAALEVTRAGFVSRYPGLWESERESRFVADGAE